MSETSRDEVRARRLLVAGTLAGALLAAIGIVRSGGAPEGSLPEGAVAVVNGVAISQEAFAELVGALAQERRRTELDATERARVLDRLIDEELLLQRGLALDLPRYERSARRAIVSAVVAAVTADAEATAPDDAELERFLATEPDRFRRSGRMTLDVVHAGVAKQPEVVAYNRAVEAVKRLRAGEEAGAVGASLGDPLPVPLPSGPVTVDDLRAAVGPSTAAAAEKLAIGQVSDPVRSGTGWVVVALRAREPGVVPPLAEIRDLVRSEYQRSAGERALAQYLEELRASARLVRRDPGAIP